jgi:hypothetical protein
MRTAGRKVGELARRPGLSVRTLHWYAEIGLLSPSQHTDAARRFFTAAEVDRLLGEARLRRPGPTASGAPPARATRPPGPASAGRGSR